MIDAILVILTVVVAVGVGCAYAAPSVNPNTAWLFAYAGLAAPMLYLANLFLMLYWAIRWKPLFFLPAILLLIGLPKVKAFYRFSDENPTETMKNSEGITLMTCNVEGFLSYDEGSGRAVSTAREITDFIRERDPDIVCFQEFQTTPGVPGTVIDQWLAGWPHRKIQYTVEQNFGLALYSKFPILSAEGITFAGSYNGSIRAELLTAPGDTLRVICNHLETTYIKEEDITFLQPNNFADDPDKSGRIRTIAGRLRRGFRKRAVQADSVAGWIAARNLPTVVCGDFNDPPISYSYKTIRGSYGDTFEEAGSGYGYTYKRFYRLLRIDYILHSPELTTLAYDSPDVPWSDHRPVIATLQIPND